MLKNVLSYVSEFNQSIGMVVVKDKENQTKPNQKICLFSEI